MSVTYQHYKIALSISTVLRYVKQLSMVDIKSPLISIGDSPTMILSTDHLVRSNQGKCYISIRD